MPNNLIFWHSGTGNSRYVAQRINGEFSQWCQSELISVGDCIKKQKYSFRLSAGDSVGFVFPTYFWGVPSIISDFIQKLELEGASASIFIYLVLTCGGSTGMCDRMMSKLLARKGYKLNVAFSVTMPDTYCILLDLMNPKDQIEPILKGSMERIEKLLPALKDLAVNRSYDENSKYPITEYKGEYLIDRGSHPSGKTSLMYPLYKYGRSTSPFHAEDNCIGCGKCAEVCPTGVISMMEMKTEGSEKTFKRPVWKQGKCAQCLACLHSCPVEAVQYGKKTKGRSRYLFPVNNYPI